MQMAIRPLAGQRCRACDSALHLRARARVMGPLSARFASTRAPAPPPVRGARARDSRPASAPPAAKRQDWLTSWPWRPTGDNSPSPPPGYADEERVVYARPYEGPLGTRVKMLWFMLPLGGMIIGLYVTKPDVRRHVGEDGEPIEGEAMWEVTERPWYWTIDKLAVIFGATFMMTFWTSVPSRYITRLALVRRHYTNPTGAREAPQVFVRMQHGGHLMSLSTKPPMRDVPIKDMKVRALGKPGSTSYLEVGIKPRTLLQRITDLVHYRMDFRDTARVKESTEEVVLSIRRLEHVFGELR